MGWRGDEFVAIDGDAFGDGDASSHPMDTWLANRLWANTMYLAQEPTMVCWSPAIDNADNDSQAGVRPFALLNAWAQVWTGAIVIPPGARSITLISVANIWQPSAHVTEVSYKLSIPGKGDYVTGTWAQGDSGGSAIRCADQLTFTFDEVHTGPALYFEFVLSVKSIKPASVAIIDTSSNGWATHAAIFDAVTSPAFFVDSATGNPDADSLEVAALNWIDFTDLNYLDMICVEDTSGKGGIHSSKAYTVQAPTEFGYEPTSTFLMHLIEMTFYAPRSLALRVNCDTESVGRIVQAALAPNRPVDSGVTQKQISAIRALVQRPRLLLMGPRGVLGAAGYSTRNYRQCWPSVQGDAAATTIVDDAFEVYTENPVLKFNAYFACLNHDMMGQFNVHGDSRQSLGDNKAGVDTGANPGRARWSFVISVTQMANKVGGGATWASNATSVASESASWVFRLNAAGRDPSVFGLFERQMEARWQDADAFLHKEGTLVEGDQALMQRVEFELVCAGLDATETQRPLRITVTAEHESASTANDYLRNDATATGPRESRVVLYLLSYTLTEWGDIPSTYADPIP